MPCGFFGEMQCYRAKITLFIFIKGRKIRKNSGRNFRKISEIPKIRENFPRKFPENSRKIEGFFEGKRNVTERKSIFLSLKNRGKSGKIPGKFRGNFGKFRKFRKFREIFPGKCRGHFSPKSCIF